MRRIKVILAVVAAVATMMVLAAPAMADVSGGGIEIDFPEFDAGGGLSFGSFSGGSGDFSGGSGDFSGGDFSGGSGGISSGDFSGGGISGGSFG
jgi:hypothetical protein